MEIRQKLIKSIKESHKAIDDYNKLSRVKLYRMMKDIPIKDLKELDSETNLDLYNAEEEYKTYLRIRDGLK